MKGADLHGRRLSIACGRESGRGNTQARKLAGGGGVTAGAQVRGDGGATWVEKRGGQKGHDTRLPSSVLCLLMHQHVSSFTQISPSLPTPWTEKHFSDDLSRLPFIAYNKFLMMP